jgi:hypothetical protein
MASDDIEDEKVGYGRPPKATRFKPGQSGNPAGRPKGELNVATALDAELKLSIVVRENGRNRKISKAEGIAKALTMKALKGDTKAFAQIMALLPQQFRQAELAPRDLQPSETDQAILERLVTRKIRERGENLPQPSSFETEKTDDR